MNTIQFFVDEDPDDELPGEWIKEPVGGVDYAYDGLGRLMWRSGPPEDIEDDETEVRLFFHDRDRDVLTLETTGTGGTVTRYVLDSAGVQVGQQQVSPDKGFGWYVTDLRGNLTQLLDNTTTADVKAVYNYDPFGQAKPGLTAEASGWTSRLRYQMAPRDPATGRYHLGPRLYDPGINLFLGADHYLSAAANLDLALDPLTGNRYLYAGCNPIGMIDDGHAPKKGSKAALTKARPRTLVRCVLVTAAGIATTFGFTIAGVLSGGLSVALIAASGGAVSTYAVWRAQYRLRCSYWITAWSM